MEKAHNLLMMTLTALIKIYRYCFSSLFPNACRFYPTCSQYAETAIKRHGTLKGCYLTLRRLFRCHPWHTGGIDDVPHCKETARLSSPLINASFIQDDNIENKTNQQFIYLTKD
jgi:putative membrane protein insertion efficiency factor